MKLKITELKKHLNELDKKQLIQLISQLYKTDEKAQQFFTMQFRRDDATAELLDQTKKHIDKNFSIDAKGRFNLDVPGIKNQIKKFWNLTNDLENTTDLQLYFVESGTQFTLRYGDIDQRYYNDLLKMFEKVVNTCQKDTELFRHFWERLIIVVSESENIGWSYGMAMEELYYSLSHLCKDKD